jgi:hypothetical protein
MSAIKLKDEGEFAPNILLRIFEDSPTSSLETASQGVSNYIKTLENPTVLTDKTGEINGQRWHVAEFIRRDKTVGDIIQQVATTAIKAPEVTWVYRLTGTALSVNAKTDFTEIRQLLASAVVEETRD